jgi:hypothetical protein
LRRLNERDADPIFDCGPNASRVATIDEEVLHGLKSLVA